MRATVARMEELKMIKSPPVKTPVSKRTDDLIVQESLDGERLEIQMSGARHGRLYAVAVALAAGILVITIAFVIAARHRPGLWVFVALGLLALFAVSARAVELSRVAKPHSLTIELTGDVIRDGERIGRTSAVDWVNLRDVLQEDKPIDHTVLLLELVDGKRIVAAETIGMPGGRARLEEAARAVSQFLEVQVKETSRQDTEAWMDM